MRFFPSLIVIVVIVILSDYVQWSAASCTYCRGEECNAPPPTKCPFGEYTNRCLRRDCLKGPGEKCGGPTRNSFGECTTGLYCHADGRCHGCFLGNLDCYPPAESNSKQY